MSSAAATLPSVLLSITQESVLHVGMATMGYLITVELTVVRQCQDRPVLETAPDIGYQSISQYLAMQSRLAHACSEECTRWVLLTQQ